MTNTKLKLSIWRPIPMLPGYEASTNGEIRRAGKDKNGKKHKPLVPSDHNHGNGYLKIKVRHKSFYVHQLVLNAFKGEKPEGYQCDHIDHDRHNNKIDNLRYLSASDNVLNRRNYVDQNGNLIIMSRPLYMFGLDGEALEYFSSIPEAVQKTQISYQSIHRALNSETHYSKGYIWYYADEAEEANKETA